MGASAARDVRYTTVPIDRRSAPKIVEAGVERVCYLCRAGGALCWVLDTRYCSSYTKRYKAPKTQEVLF